MALVDLIARGNTDIPSFVESYQSGRRNMREGRAAQQTAELRNLQIGQARKEAGTWGEDRTRRMEREDVQLEGARQGIDVQTQQMEAQTQQMEQVRVGMERDIVKFEDYKTDKERKTHIYNLKESDRFITAATTEGVDFVDYITKNADDIKEVGGDNVDQVVDAIIGGDLTPDQIEQVKTQLLNTTDARQVQLRKLEAIREEGTVKAQIATAKAAATVDKPGDLKELTGPTLGLIKDTMIADTKFDMLDGSWDEDNGSFTKDKGKAMASVKAAFQTMRDKAKYTKKGIDTNMALSDLTALVKASSTDNKFWDDTFNKQSFDMYFQEYLKGDIRVLPDGTIQRRKKKE